MRDSFFRSTHPCNTRGPFRNKDLLNILTNIGQWSHSLLHLHTNDASYPWWPHDDIPSCPSHLRPSDSGCRARHWTQKQEGAQCSPQMTMMMMTLEKGMSMAHDPRLRGPEDWRHRGSRTSGWGRSPAPRRWWLTDASCCWEKIIVKQSQTYEQIRICKNCIFWGSKSINYMYLCQSIKIYREGIQYYGSHKITLIDTW